jgi:microcystin-dependent protein
VADPFVAEIRIVPFNFAPLGWAKCNGQLMPLSQNTALFSLLGINYGGNGSSTFALPDLQDRTPMHSGAGAGLSPRAVGNFGGQAAVSLDTAELPAHTHGPLKVRNTAATSGTPSATRSLAQSTKNIYGPAGNLVPMGDAVGGAAAPHSNRQPFLQVNFIIALQGVFPERPTPAQV